MTKAKGSAAGGAKKGMSLQELKVALLEDEEFIAAIAAAMPMPVPMHMLVTPILWFVRFNSVRSVLTCLAPVTPSG